MSELKIFTSDRIYWAVEQVERKAGDITDLHLDDNLFYLKYEADKVIATIQTERDAYENELGCVKTAAAALLENYSGQKPSAGEVDALAEDLTQLLTEKYNISKGII